MPRRPEFIGGLIGLAVVLAIFFAFVIGGWPGALDDCLTSECYCERARPGNVKQPSNTWFNVGFMIAGLWLLWRLRDEVASPIAMRRPTFAAISYGAAVIFLGPGSMFFHASLTRWGGLVDNISMFIWAGWVLAWQAVRLAHWQPWWAMALIWAALVVTASLITGLVDGAGTICFAVLIALACITEIVICAARPRGIVRDWRWLIATFAVFAIAALVWALSGGSLGDGGVKRGPWCDPDAFLQGHAVWHLLCAVATVLYAVYLRSEREDR